VWTPKASNAKPQGTTLPRAIARLLSGGKGLTGLCRRRYG
jgi:hypothetical protein